MVQLQIYLAPLLDCDASCYLDNAFKARNIYYFRNDLFFLHLLKEISISTCFCGHQILQKEFHPYYFLCFYCRIGHDNKGGFAGWYLDNVEIDAPSLGKKWVFPAGRWLDKGKDDGKTEVDLFPSEDREVQYVPRK